MSVVGALEGDLVADTAFASPARRTQASTTVGPTFSKKEDLDDYSHDPFVGLCYALLC